MCSDNSEWQSGTTATPPLGSVVWLNIWTLLYKIRTVNCPCVAVQIKTFQLQFEIFVRRLRRTNGLIGFHLPFVVDIHEVVPNWNNVFSFLPDDDEVVQVIHCTGQLDGVAFIDGDLLGLRYELGISLDDGVLRVDTVVIVIVIGVVIVIVIGVVLLGRSGSAWIWNIQISLINILVWREADGSWVG